LARIFLSHSVANNAEAIAVRDWIVAQGWSDVFLDLDPHRGLAGGEQWQAALAKAVHICELVIFLVSPEWAGSTWCKAEFLLAKHGRNPKAILPVIVSPVSISALPIEMTAEYQHVDLSAEPRSVELQAKLSQNETAVTVKFSADGLRRLKIGIERAGIDAKHFDWPPKHEPQRSPYRGLKPLEAEDAGIFFGREAPVLQALDGLRGLRETAPPRLLVILGGSGAGKSSFLRAGLLPRLARDDRHFRPLPVIRPDRAVLSGETGLLRALEGAFETASDPGRFGPRPSRPELRMVIEGGVSPLKAILKRLADAATPDHIDGWPQPEAPSLVLAIDQGEELFKVDGQEEAKRFLVLLAELLAADAPAVTAIVTIRSDNYERLQFAQELANVRKVPFDLGPMPKGSYSEVIKGPAGRLENTSRALRIDEDLVQALLEDIDAGGAKDALPLLAFTLERLYEEFRLARQLRLEHYEALGRVKGSIEAAVERALKDADKDPAIPVDREARLALLRRSLIPWLAGIDPDTGSPRRRVARLSEIPVEARPLINHLVNHHLLSTDVSKVTGEKTIEPAHEALLRQWGMLEGWLKQDTALLSVMDGLHRASRDWVANAKDGAWLAHTADRLKAAQRLLERPDLAAKLEPTDLDYLQECRDAEKEKEKRALRDKLTMGVLAAILLMAAIGWFNQDRLKEHYFWLTQVRSFLLKPEQERAIAAGMSFKECATSCPEMVVVPPGSFTMGSPDGAGSDEERPAHKVTISYRFAVSKFPITFDQWDACVAFGGCKNPGSSGPWGRGSRPAINISWDDAHEYVAWLSKLTNRPYRLLSEAQWEYAARAGSASNYSFGDEEQSLREHAWYSNNSGGQTQTVGQRKPNAFGLYDMHGNIWQWVEDNWHDTYDGAPADGTAWRGGEVTANVLRGGSWYDNASRLRSAARQKGRLGNRAVVVGFRILRLLISEVDPAR
jgi:formylglycine-generating enzyme required for sulfatase activity